MIDITNLSADYGREPVLQHVNLHVAAGCITTIIGPNGCGKSTLLKCIARQMKRAGGEITLRGTPIDTFAPKELAKHISYLKQSREVPVIPVENFVMHGRFPYLGFPRKLTEQDKLIARRAMEKTGVWDLRHQELPELSGGQCQKVYLAMTLAQSAEVLLLDEPTTYLDIKHQLELLDLMCRLRSEGQTMVAVLHDINSAVRISDAICVIDRGRVAFFGTPAALLETDIISRVFGVQVTPLHTAQKQMLSFDLAPKPSFD